MFWKREDKTNNNNLRNVDELRKDIVKYIGARSNSVINNVKFQTFESIGDRAMFYTKVVITLINDDEELIVFEDKWTHEGSWCKKINEILDNIKEQKQRGQTRKEKELKDKVARFEKAFGNEDEYGDGLL